MYRLVKGLEAGKEDRSKMSLLTVRNVRVSSRNLGGGKGSARSKDAAPKRS